MCTPTFLHLPIAQALSSYRYPCNPVAVEAHGIERGLRRITVELLDKSQKRLHLMVFSPTPSKLKAGLTKARSGCPGPCPVSLENLRGQTSHHLSGACTRPAPVFWKECFPYGQPEFSLLQPVPITSCPFPVDLSLSLSLSLPGNPVRQWMTAARYPLNLFSSRLNKLSALLFHPLLFTKLCIPSVISKYFLFFATTPCIAFS